MKILSKFTKDEIEKMLNNADSFKDFLEKIGCKSFQSHVYRRIQKELKELNINYSKENFNYNNRVIARKKTAKSNDETFIVGEKFRTRIKVRIIDDKLIPYICDFCKNEGSWNNKKLILSLDHINGINTDNRLENLRFLCPNCHSQTDTFCGKNFKEKEKKKYYCECGVQITRISKNCKKCYDIKQRRVERPDYESLIKDIKELGYKKTGIKLNVKDGTLRKWIIYYEKLNLEKNEGIIGLSA